MRTMHKRVLSLLIKFTLVLMAFSFAGCKMDQMLIDGPDIKRGRTINIYDSDNNMTTSHTLSDNNLVESTDMYLEYGTITKTYSYGVDDELSAISRRDPLGNETVTRISNNENTSRSGNKKTVTRTFSTSSGARAGGIDNTYTYTYNYDDNGKLSSISKNFGADCLEVKNSVGKAADIADKISKDMSGLSRAAGQINSDVSDDEEDIPDWVSDPDEISTTFHDVQMGIMGNIIDLRDDGICNRIVNGREVETNIVDLEVGSIFIDSDEAAKKVVSIETNGNTTSIHTVQPRLDEIFYYIDIPNQTVLISHPSNMVQGVNEGTTVNDSRFISLDKDASAGLSVGYSFETYLINSRYSSLKLEASAEVGATISAGYHYGDWTWYGRYYSGYAYVYFSPGIDVSMGLTYNLERSASCDVPLAFYQDQYASLYLYMGCEASGKVEAYAKTGVFVNGVAGVHYSVNKYYIPNNMQLVNTIKYGYSAEAGISGEFEVKPRLHLKAAVELFKFELLSIDPGAGVYFEMEGRLEGGYAWDSSNGYTKNGWEAAGSVEAGVFFDVEMELLQTYPYTLFEYEYPFFEYEYGAQSVGWHQLSTVKSMRQISAASDGTLAACGKDSNAYLYDENSERFTQLSSDGNTARVAVINDKNILRINKTEVVQRWNGSSWGQNEAGYVYSLDASNDGMVYITQTGHGDRRLFKHQYDINGGGPIGGWNQFPGGALMVSGVNKNDVWVVDGGYNVQRKIGNGGWRLMGIRGWQVDCGSDGNVYVLTLTNEIRKFNGYGWDKVDGVAYTLAYGNSDHFYKLDNDGRLYIYEDGE